MAIAPVNKFLSVSTPVAPGEQKLYEVPTGTSSILLYAQVSNVGVGTYPKVTFIQRRESRSTGNTRDIRIIKEVEVPPNDAVILVDGRLVLEKTASVLDSVYITSVQSGIVTITNVEYYEPTGVATITTSTPHGFESEMSCPGGSGITTTIFPSPQRSFVIDNIESDVGGSKTFTTNVGSANGISHTYVSGGLVGPLQLEFIGSILENSTV
jgi:hypothetical protein